MTAFEFVEKHLSNLGGQRMKDGIILLQHMQCDGIQDTDDVPDWLIPTFIKRYNLHQGELFNGGKDE